MKPSLADIKHRAKLPEYSSGEGYVQVPFSDWTELLWLLEQAEKAEQELGHVREAVEMELRRHLCYTSDYSRERFWTQVDARLSEQPEEQR